jgi:hypothetical protein
LDTLFAIILGLGGAWCFYLAYRGIKSGSIRLKGFTFKRNIEPFLFWFTVAVLGIIGSMVTRGALKLLFPKA